MCLMCHCEINSGQHHEDEGLQGHDENVEDCPAGVQERATDDAADTGGREQRNQKEDHFASVHVAKQTQGKRQRLGDQFDQLEREVKRQQHDLCDDVVRVERGVEELVDVAADAFGFDAFNHHQ